MKSYDLTRKHIKSRDITFLTKAHIVKAMFLWMWELDHTGSWALKNWCFQTVVLQRTLESPLHSKEMNLVYPKGSEQWIFIGRTDAEVEASIPWSLDVKSWLIGKDHDAGKDWWQMEQRKTEDEMVGWHHRLDGHKFEQAPGAGDRQGSSWTRLSY